MMTVRFLDHFAVFYDNNKVFDDNNEIFEDCDNFETVLKIFKVQVRLHFPTNPTISISGFWGREDAV